MPIAPSPTCVFRVRKHVRELITVTTSQHAMGTHELTNELTDMALTGTSLDETTLQEMFTLIIDPKGTGEARWPQGSE